MKPRFRMKAIITTASLECSVFDEDNACWECSECHVVNNVRLTVENENMNCCGCRKTHFVPDETKTFQSRKWNHHKDYLLKTGAWICSFCTFENEDISTNTCSVCNQKNSFSNLFEMMTVQTQNAPRSALPAPTPQTQQIQQTQQRAPKRGRKRKRSEKDEEGAPFATLNHEELPDLKAWEYSIAPSNRSIQDRSSGRV